LSRIIVEDFLKCSWMCAEAIVKKLATFKENRRLKVPLFYFKTKINTI